MKITLVCALSFALAMPAAVHAARHMHDFEEPQPQTQSVDTPCTHELGFLRRVRAEDLAPVTEKHKVWVVPICVNEDSAFRNAGNVGKLRSAIAANVAMKQALGEKAFSAHDVVGIRKTDIDKVTLYVLPPR